MEFRRPKQRNSNAQSRFLPDCYGLIREALHRDERQVALIRPEAILGGLPINAAFTTTLLVRTLTNGERMSLI